MASERTAKVCRREHKGFAVLMATAVFVVGLAVFSMAAPQSYAKTIYQSGDALRPYSISNFRLCANTSYGQQNSTSFAWVGYSRHRLVHSRGNLSARFATSAFLAPYNYVGDYYDNPQGCAVTPNGRYLYVAYQRGKSKSYSNPPQGRIVKYNLRKLRRCRKSYGNVNPAAYIRSCIVKVGGWFTMGHGQNLAYNPKRRELWMSTRPCQTQTNLTRINRKSLAPNLVISFRLKSTVKMGTNLCFDNAGRFYFWTQASTSSWGSNCPAGTVKIYRGRINKKRTRVRVRLFMTGIKNAPSTSNQGMAYNPRNDCLYLIGNSAVMRIPLPQMRKRTLRAGDVKTEIFSPIREFEGLAFTQKGNGYLLVNKIPEIMRTKGL